ncbi:MAG: AtpZ/AtpI family protein [SAR202 cluster bacterium]|nr:AtpZ/AtpI family protein [SAR202 cluster bacterium]
MLAVAYRLLGIGMYIALCIAGGALLGYLLDRSLDTRPLLTLVCLGLGIAFAMIGMFRMLRTVLAASAQEYKKKDRKKSKRE